MHGLIFKIKESHRQDQSESFVIYIYIYAFIFTTSQMKSLHYDQCLLYIIIYIFVVSSRRNKTNPHHRNKFIPVLNATHLQAFKPKLSTYDQLLKTDQQDVSLYVYMCISWNIFNRIHFFAICDVYFICNLFVFYMIFIYDHLKSWRSSFDKLFFFIIYNLFHIANQLYETQLY